MCAAIGIGTKLQTPTTAATMALPGLNNGGPAGGDVVNAGTSTVAAPVAPGTTDLAGMTRKRKTNVLQTGILSTVNTSAGGTSAAPTLVAPAASGGGKTALGQ